MVRLSRASRPIKFINSDVVTASARSRANYGSTAHFGVVHNIVVRLSRASRPIKFIYSDVVTAGVKARRIMVQLPTLELSINCVSTFASESSIYSDVITAGVSKPGELWFNYPLWS